MQKYQYLIKLKIIYIILLIIIKIIISKLTQISIHAFMESLICLCIILDIIILIVSYIIYNFILVSNGTPIMHYNQKSSELNDKNKVNEKNEEENKTM